MMKIKLVENWKDSPNWWSIKWQLALMLLAVVTAFLPLLQVHLSAWVYSALIGLGAVLTTVFRILSQTLPEGSN